MIVLDTHVLLWSRFGGAQIGPASRQLIEQALQANTLAVSAFSFWEVAMLHDKGRMSLLSDIGTWRMNLLEEGLTSPSQNDFAVR